MTTRKGLVLSVGTPKRLTTSDSGDNSTADRLAEIDRLVWATTPMLQMIAFGEYRIESMREWLVDNPTDRRYDERQREADRLAGDISATREAVRRNARAVRVHVLRLPEAVRPTLLARHGLDYSTTGDSAAELDHQWRHLVELCSDPCPF